MASGYELHYSREASAIAGARSGNTALPCEVSLPESAETFRTWNVSFLTIESNQRSRSQRTKLKVPANHRIQEGSLIGVAKQSLPDGTEELLLANCAAFSLVLVSNVAGGGKSGSSTIEPEAFYRGRGSPANRDLPRPLALTGTQQASRQACPGGRSRGRRSREVALHEFRLDDSHGSATTLPTLVSLPQKFLRSVSPPARICISLHR
jgi:hypothetical protein